VTRMAIYNSDRLWKLPPLILHPFTDITGPTLLVESSRANLILKGLLSAEAFSPEQLKRTLLEGRYCEVRMLYYVGKDLVRWLEQCVELAAREDQLRNSGIKEQSFASLLLEDPPPIVREKLNGWGVTDYRSIFSRSLGLNAVFAEAPERCQLTDDFVRSYHSFADHMYTCYRTEPFTEIHSVNFDFEIYASGEYSRLLEREWQKT